MTLYKLSRILQPKIVIPPGKDRATDAVSTSQKLLENLGLVRLSDGGTVTLLPLAVRALHKLKKLISKEIEKTGALEIILPALTSHRLLEQTGRDGLPELFKLQDRHKKDFVLSPTHEEAVTNLVASLKPTFRQLPLCLYQITSKFRDEMKPRFGLMRSKEFLMKDLYIFETSPELAMESYHRINASYHDIFDKLDVPYVRVMGSPGEIGGSMSDEFHVLSSVGEDKIVKCSDCGHAENLVNLVNNRCKQCEGRNLNEHYAIEVGHSFLLGTRYTKPLNATYVDSNNQAKYLEMSCHGIGISRLLAACVESLSKTHEIRWPRAIAPFSLCLIPPKAGSKEENSQVPIQSLITQLADIAKDDTFIDDRTELTIGKRLLEAKQIGYPFVVIFGKSVLETTPKIELFDTHHERSELIHPDDLPSTIQQKLTKS